MNCILNWVFLKVSLWYYSVKHLKVKGIFKLAISCFEIVAKVKRDCLDFIINSIADEFEEHLNLIRVERKVLGYWLYILEIRITLHLPVLESCQNIFEPIVGIIPKQIFLDISQSISLIGKVFACCCKEYGLIFEELVEIFNNKIVKGDFIDIKSSELSIDWCKSLRG